MQIPDYIFDWIEDTPFEALTPHQKKEVQNHISADEYNELHQAATIAAGYMTIPNSTTDATLLDTLHTHFDHTYPPKQTKFSVLLAWKVAASVLLLAVAILSLGLYNATQKSATVIKVSTDTVYVQVAKEIPLEVKVYDTIYISTNTSKEKRKETTIQIQQPIGRERLAAPQQLNSIPFADKDKLQNAPRGNSFKDDSLARNFGFVSL